MTHIELDEEERRLITVVRAIAAFGKEELVSKADASSILIGLESVFDLDKLTKDLGRPGELAAIVLGFVGGIAAVAKSEQAAPESYQVYADPQYQLDDLEHEELDQVVAGEGPSSAIPRGQLEGDNRYVHQTGPREDQEV